MDPNLSSHLVLAVIGVISALGLVLTVVSFWSMGRANYRK